MIQVTGTIPYTVPSKNYAKNTAEVRKKSRKVRKYPQKASVVFFSLKMSLDFLEGLEQEHARTCKNSKIQWKQCAFGILTKSPMQKYGAHVGHDDAQSCFQACRFGGKSAVYSMPCMYTRCINLYMYSLRTVVWCSTACGLDILEFVPACWMSFFLCVRRCAANPSTAEGQFVSPDADATFGQIAWPRLTRSLQILEFKSLELSLIRHTTFWGIVSL